MKKKANRALSLLLSVVMCISLLPASAFAAVQSGDTIYVKMTAPPTEGDQVIITNTEGTQALTYTGSGTTRDPFKISAVSVTPDSNDVITASGTAKVWTVSGSGSSMKFHDGSNYLRRASFVDTSLTISSNNNNTTWSVSENTLYYHGILDSYYLRYNNNSFSTSTTESTIAFYKAYTVAADPVKASNLTYDGTAQVLVEGGTGYTLTSTGEKVASIATDDVGSVKKGDAFAENAGSYQITATLKAGYAWSDGTTAAKVIDVTIDKKSVTAPNPATSLTYNGSVRTLVNGSTNYTLSCTNATAGQGANGAITAKNVGIYPVTAALKDPANYKWSGSTSSDDKSFTVTIAKANASITPADKEVMKGAFTDADLPTAAVNGVCSGESIDYVIVVTDKDGKVINTLGADSKTYEPVTADQLNALVVGEYTLSIQLLADDASAAVQANYNLTASDTAVLTVGPKTSDVQVWDDASQKFVKDTSGLTITGTDVNNADYTNADASGNNLVVKVLSQGDPITATTEAGLVLADNESVVARFEVNLYLNNVKMNPGATLNKKIQVQVPVDAKDGEYVIAHWDGAKYTRLTETGIVANGILTFATDTFSPFVMIGTTTYVKMIGTPADEEGYTVTFVNTRNTVIVDSDGTALSEKGEAYVFTVTAKPGYQIVSVTDNGTEMTPVGSTYTIPAAAADTNHKIVVTASPADVSLTIVYGNGTADNTATYPYGVSVNLPGAPTKNGYTFAGWLSTKENKTYGAGDPFTPTVDDTLTAVWVADITVSYNVDGTITSATVPAGDSVLLPAAPTHTDKVFTGWKSANTGAIFAAETLYTPAANDTLTAQWVDKYVITVKSDSATVDTMKVAPGANATVPDAPTKSGYVFVGWYSTANAQTYAPGYLYTPAGDDTLTARWAQLYAVIYDTNNGNGTAPSESDKVAGAEFIVKGAELTRDGYTFVGWKSSATGVTYQPGAFYTMTAEDTTFTAQWEKVATYTVTYAANGGTGTDVVDTKEYYELDTVSVKDNTWTAPAGKVFAGWKSSVDGTIYNEGDSFNMPGMNVILTAQWADVAATYTVTYSVGSGKGTAPIDSKAYAENASVTAAPSTGLSKDGCTFAGWLRSDNGAIVQAGDVFNMPAKNITLTAQWAGIDKYTVTYNVEGKTTIDPNTYAENAVYTVSGAPTKTGYIFTGWRNSVDDVIYADGATFLMPAQNVTLIATWVEEDAIFHVTYDMNGATSTQITDTNDYKYAEVVKVKDTTPAKTDYTFAGWLRSDNGEIVNAGDNINMPACNLTLTAQWNAVVKYTVNYELDGGTASIAPGEYLGLAQATVTTTEPIKDGYRFMGWLDKTSGIEYASGEHFTMPEKNITLTAQWAKLYTVVFDLNDGGHSGNTTPAEQKVVLGDKLTSVGAINDYKYGTPEVKYYFNGWKNQNGNYWSFDYDVVDAGCFDSTGTMKLTAQWDTEKTYNVKFDDNLNAPQNDYFYYTGNAAKDKVPASSRLTYADYPVFNRVDYILGVDGTQDCDWYLDAAYTYPYDVTKTLAENNADVFAEADGTLTLYAKWTAKYDAADEVAMDAASLTATGTYNTYYSDWVEAWKVTNNVLTEKTVPVYRNFYLISGNLPDGLNLNKRTGEIYGVPTKVGTYTFTLVMANDEVDLISAPQAFTITIEPNILSIDHNDLTYAKTYGDADPAKLLKNNTNLNKSLSVTANVTAITLTDTDNSLTIDYSYVNDNNDRNANAATFSAADAATLKYAPDLAAPSIADTLTDALEVFFSRTLGEDAGDYKLYMPVSNVTGAAVTAGAYTIDIPADFQKADTANVAAKYIFTIDKATLTIGATGLTYPKTYGENDPVFPTSDLTVSTANASTIGKNADTTLTVAFTGAGFTDTFTIAPQRVYGEDIGDKALSLTEANITTTATTKTVAGHKTDAAIKDNYTFDLTGYTGNKLTITQLATTFTPTKSYTYGDLKVGDVIPGSYSALIDTDTNGNIVVSSNPAAAEIVDVASDLTVKVSAPVSGAGYVKAGETQAILSDSAISNSKYDDSVGATNATAQNTTGNYTITLAPWTIAQKPLSVAGQTVNVNNGSAPTAANIEALAKLEGVLSNDEVGLTVEKYVCDSTDYATAADLIAALGTITADKAVTVYYSATLTGADAANYTLAAGSVDATLKAYTASSGGGGGGGGVVTYAITVNSAENGSVTSSSKSAAAGTTVTLTVKPDTGYTLETLTVTNAKGNEVSVTAKDGKYTFTMPASKVTVTATFMEDNTVLNFFVDVPVDAYYYEAVRWAVVNGITSGTSATTFSPDASCTRAQIVTFLWRAAGSPAPESDEMPFVDVPADAYYYDAVLWAVENGITSGTSATTFSPNATCTRAQSVTFLWRAQGSPAVEAESIFTDVADDVYYAEAVLWAVEEGITNGTSSTTFSPNDDCTRAQIVTFIWRALAE